VGLKDTLDPKVTLGHKDLQDLLVHKDIQAHKVTLVHKVKPVLQVHKA
jgi:hypothetical protein